MRCLWSLVVGSLLVMSAEAAPLPEPKNDALAFEAALASGAQLPLRIQAMGNLGPFDRIAVPVVGVGRPLLKMPEPPGRVDGENSWLTAMPILKEDNWLHQYAIGRLSVLTAYHQMPTTLFLTGPARD